MRRSEPAIGTVVVVIASVTLVTIGACGDDVGQGLEAEGGSGGVASGESSTNHYVDGPSYMMPMSSSSSSSSVNPGSCDAIGTCEGDEVTPDSGCTECAILGDEGTAYDGGDCADEYAACFGDGSMECTGAADPECCQIYDCLEACDSNMDGALQAGTELDCFCTNNGTQCVMNQLQGTCLGTTRLDSKRPSCGRLASSKTYVPTAACSLETPYAHLLYLRRLRLLRRPRRRLRQHGARHRR